MVKIGNAPVSYGAFEVTVGKHEGVPTATEVLDAVRRPATRASTSARSASSASARACGPRWTRAACC